MDVTLKVPTSLVGVAVTKDNLVVGYRVSRGSQYASEWREQGEGYGVIIGKIDGSLYDLDYDFATVKWDDATVNNYPLNIESLVFTNAKKKTSIITKFVEKTKQYDVFKVKNCGQVFPAEIKDKDVFFLRKDGKQLVFNYFNETSNRMNEVSVSAFDLEQIKLNKVSRVSASKKILNELAERFQSPVCSKEYLLKQISESEVGLNYLLLSYTRNRKNLYSDDFLDNIYRTYNISTTANSFTIEETKFGHIKFERNRFGTFYIYNDRIREFIQANYKHADGADIYKTYKDWLDFFGNAETKTHVNKKVLDTIQVTTCSEQIKEFLLACNYGIKENFIDYDKGTKTITFTPQNKPVEIAGGNRLSTKNRQSMSPHKFFMKVLKNANVPEYELKCFVDEFIAAFGEYKISPISGTISDFYNTLSQRGWAVGSCMLNKSRSFFEVYDKNPDKFTMMMIVLNGEIVGRFLSVNAKDAEDDSDFHYYDRLYYKDEEVVAFFNAYCEQNNIPRKTRNSHTDMLYFTINKKNNIEKRIYVRLAETNQGNNWKYQLMPYLDTLRYGNYDTLMNFNENFAIKEVCNRETPRFTFSRDGGGYHDAGRNFCFYENRRTDENVITITDEASTYFNQTVLKERTIEVNGKITIR